MKCPKPSRTTNLRRALESRRAARPMPRSALHDEAHAVVTQLPPETFIPTEVTL